MINLPLPSATVGLPLTSISAPGVVKPITVTEFRDTVLMKSGRSRFKKKGMLGVGSGVGVGGGSSVGVGGGSSVGVGVGSGVGAGVAVGVGTGVGVGVGGGTSVGVGATTVGAPFSGRATVWKQPSNSIAPASEARSRANRRGLTGNYPMGVSNPPVLAGL